MNKSKLDLIIDEFRLLNRVGTVVQVFWDDRWQAGRIAAIMSDEMDISLLDSKSTITITLVRSSPTVRVYKPSQILHEAKRGGVV